jgi:hypothetical protein
VENAAKVAAPSAKLSAQRRDRASYQLRVQLLRHDSREAIGLGQQRLKANQAADSADCGGKSDRYLGKGLKRIEIELRGSKDRP